MLVTLPIVDFGIVLGVQLASMGMQILRDVPIVPPGPTKTKLVKPTVSIVNWLATQTRLVRVYVYSAHLDITIQRMVRLAASLAMSGHSQISTDLIPVPNYGNSTIFINFI